MNIDQLRKELEIDEGVIHEIYMDHLGYPTFGIGHLVTKDDPEYGQDEGTAISERRVIDVFNDDIRTVLIDCGTPRVFEENLHVWHLFVIRTKKRNQFIRFMKEKNIELGIHYPKAIHHQKAYSSYKFNKSNFKNANKFSSQLVSLPIFPLMRLKEKEYVVKNIFKFFNQ